MNIIDTIIMWLENMKEVIMNAFNKLTLWFKNFKKKKTDNGPAKIGNK